MTFGRFFPTDSPWSRSTGMTENLIHRAARLISSSMTFGGMTAKEAEKAAMVELVESGVAVEDAFLAVKAGKIYVS